MIQLRIESTLLNNLLQKNKIDFLKEGSIFKAKIVDIKDSIIIINIPEFGLLEASLDVKSELEIGERILFLVKSINNNKVFLKPLVNTPINQKIDTIENPIARILTELGIETNQITISLIENLMANNLPINKDIVNDGIKILEKLIKLLNIKDGEYIALSEPNIVKQNRSVDIDTVDIRHLLLMDKNLDNNIKTNLSHIFDNDLMDDLENNVDVDIDDRGINDLTHRVKDYVRNHIDLDDDESLIKITGFLVKNNIKPSLRNIKYINKLDTDPMDFFKDFQEIIHLARNNNNHKINGLPSEKTEGTNGLKIISNKEEDLSEIIKIIDELAKDGDKNLERIKDVESKIDFLRELNKELNFMFFPIDIGLNDRLKGLMSFIKERKKRGKGDKLNIFINLSTENLGNIRVLCTLLGDSLSIKMTVGKKDLEFFKSTEEKLVEKILTIGYSIKEIDYITDEKISMIDSNTLKSSSSYILDLKV